MNTVKGGGINYVSRNGKSVERFDYRKSKLNKLLIGLKSYKNTRFLKKSGVFLVRVVIQNFLKKPVISTVFKADE